MRIKRISYHTEAYNIAYRAPYQQGLPASTIYEIQPHKSEHQVSAANGNGVQQRIFSGQPCSFQYFGSIV